MTDTETQGSAVGAWVLLEQQRKLLLIGETIYHGVSPRKYIGESGRKLLLPAFAQAFDDGVDQDTITEFAGQKWRVTVRLIRSANRGAILAAIGTHYPAFDALMPAPQPVVGSWEWKIETSDDGRSISTYWDEGMYSLYDLEPEMARVPVGAWPTPQWFNAVIIPEDRARMRILIDEGIDVGNDNLHSITYSVFTGYGRGHLDTRQLRLAGRAVTDDEGILWLSGISHEAKENSEDFTPGLRGSRTDGFLRAAFELARDSALAAVDTHLLEVYMTSPGWSTMGLPHLPDGAISRLLHEDDLPAFQEYIAMVACTLTSRPQDRWRSFRLRTRSGSYEQFDTLATAARVSARDNRYVLVRFSLSDPAESGSANSESLLA